MTHLCDHRLLARLHLERELDEEPPPLSESRPKSGLGFLHDLLTQDMMRPGDAHLLYVNGVPFPEALETGDPDAIALAEFAMRKPMRGHPRRAR